ncbi:MAG: carboxypeptidase M32 [bacterium]
MSPSYDRLLELAREIHHLAGASALLGWDQEVFLPPKGVPARAKNIAALSAVIHDKLTCAELGELCAELTAAAPAERVAAANVRELKRQRDRAVKIPRSLVIELAEACSLAQQAWAQAKQQDDWSLFADSLTRLVALKRQEAAAVGYEGEPYNALLDEYEPGARVEELVPLFDELKATLIPLIERIGASPQQPDDSLLQQTFPVELQDQFGREVLTAMGFDFEAGRLDISLHPFTQAMSIQDVRITTRYHENNLGSGLYANLHEGGHALYELGLPQEHEGSPVAAAVSLGIHESQSRLWENCVGRSREFCHYSLARLTELFPTQFATTGAEELYRAINVVRPSLIRIEADEVTYNLHIILRMELERALLLGDIEVADLPALWREKIRHYFSLELPGDAQGVLQDIHWAFGAFGYFPTYTLGNLYAAQFFAAAMAELADLPAQIARGEFQPLLGWLRTHIHQPGCLFPAGELCRQVTGEVLSSKPFLDSLQQKYGDIFGI